jgi:hypothetical protein
MKGDQPPGVLGAALAGFADEPCPCGSGEVNYSCCLDADGHWSPRPVTIRRGNEQTGRGLAGCYAAALADCDGKLTKEHYISDCVLRSIAENPVLEGVRGAARIEGAQNMVTRNLCKRHNAMLSPLDNVARRFTEAVRGCFPGMPRAVFSPGNETHPFHAGDVARVLLKSLCATEAGGVLGGSHPSPRGWTPPEPWLRILFDDAPWPPGWGLYVPVLRANVDKHAERVTFSRRVDQQGRLVGAEYGVAGLPFMLFMTDLRALTEWDEPEFDSVHAHPSRVVVHVQGTAKTLEFGRRADGRELTINHRIGRAEAA